MIKVLHANIVRYYRKESRICLFTEYSLLCVRAVTHVVGVYYLHINVNEKVIKFHTCVRVYILASNIYDLNYAYYLLPYLSP